LSTENKNRVGGERFKGFAFDPSPPFSSFSPEDPEEREKDRGGIFTTIYSNYIISATG